jgi:hypothetical protein
VREGTVTRFGLNLLKDEGHSGFLLASTNPATDYRGRVSTKGRGSVRGSSAKLGSRGFDALHVQPSNLKTRRHRSIIPDRS